MQIATLPLLLRFPRFDKQFVYVLLLDWNKETGYSPTRSLWNPVVFSDHQQKAIKKMTRLYPSLDDAIRANCLLKGSIEEKKEQIEFWEQSVWYPFHDNMVFRSFLRLHVSAIIRERENKKKQTEYLVSMEPSHFFNGPSLCEGNNVEQYEWMTEQDLALKTINGLEMLTKFAKEEK